jgi:hypothetical protein
MILNIIKLLKENKLYNKSIEIEIAKGKFKIPKTVKESLEQIKREFKYKQK